MNKKTKHNPIGLVSLLGVSMLYVPVSQMFLSFSSPLAYYFIPISVVTLTLIGYAMQHFYSTAIGKRAASNPFGTLKEGLFDKFRLKYSLIPIVLCVVLSVAVAVIYDSYLRRLLEANVINYYDSYYAAITFVLSLFITVSGVIIWFYPPERLSNIYVLIVGCALFIVETVFYYFIAGALSGGVVTINFNLGIPMIIFTVCTLVVFNQANLTREFRGSVVTVMKPSEKSFNLFIDFVFCILFVLAALLFYVIFSGVSILVRAIIFLILYKSFYGVVYEDETKMYEYIDPEDARGMLKKEILNSDNQSMLYIFFTVAVLGITFFVLLKTGYLKKIIKSVKLWFRDFLDTLKIGSDIFRNSYLTEEEETQYNYKDEKKNLQDAAIKDYVFMADSTGSYKHFVQRLSRLADFDSQLTYAYAVLLKVYKKNNISLRSSDTPREAEKKIVSALDEREIEEITKLFESVRYAENDISKEDAARVLDTICLTVKRHMF